MFLVYINDINENITSSVRLFADDCVLYKSITSLEDAEQLQEDLCKICEWTNKWQMKLNIDKCAGYYRSWCKNRKKFWSYQGKILRDHFL